ncbi:MAG: hypothetical protein P1U87_09940 [Verrucomicrobiales bacterium]|nr:hypothetical protein [Verrucomicrobiales bacterium]
MQHLSPVAVLASILTFLALELSSQAEEVSIDVAVFPDFPRIPVTGVPFLNESIPEAVAPEQGLSIEPEKPFEWSRISSGTTPFPITVRIAKEPFDRGVLTLWNWHNHPIGQWKLESGGSHRFRFNVSGNGVYLLTLDGYRGDQCVRRLVRSFAVTPDLNRARETWKREEFFLGICGFPGRYHWSYQGTPTLPAGIEEQEARDLEASLMARLGFQVMRTDESMEMGDRTAPDQPYRFDFRRMDAVVEAYTSRGFSLALQLMNAADWAIAPAYAEVTQPSWRFPRREEPQRAYVRALVERYGKKARLVQVFNEPDQVDFWSGEPAEFVRHYEFSKEEVREVLPDIPVISGGYSLVDPERTEFFVKTLKGKIDFPAYHSHGLLKDLIEDHETIQRMHREAGYDSPRYLNTEMGFDGWRLDQERRKGEIVPQKALYCWASGHAGVLLFGSRMTLGPNRVSQDFGFLDHWFCPRFVYGSMTAMVSTLEGASFEKALQNHDGIYAYAFRRGGERIVAAFTTNEEAKVRFETNDRSVVLIDPMGNSRAALSEGGVTLTLDGYPRYLISSGDVALLNKK